MSSFYLPLLLLALLSYAASAAWFLGHLWVRKAAWAERGLHVLMLGLGLHVVGKLDQMVELGRIPVTSSVEALSLLALGVAAVFVYVARRYGVPVLGAFATPFTFVTLAASLAFAGDAQGVVPRALQSAWFPVHLGLAITADALWMVAGLVSVTYLLQENFLRKKRLGTLFRKLPPLHVLDEICHRLIVLGWLLMSAGMMSGALYAKQEWGAYWSWDPRQTWSLLTWLLFAAILHARITVGWQGRRAAWLTLLAVALVLLALLGLNAITHTRHGGEYL